MAPSKSAKEGSKLQAIYRDARQKRHPEREEFLCRGCEISRNDQVGSEFTKQLGTRRRRAQKTPLVPPVQAGFYFADGRSPLGVAMLSPEKCRDRAAECLQWAESASSLRVRDILLDVARTWTRLAIEAEEWGQANRPIARLRSSAPRNAPREPTPPTALLPRGSRRDPH